MDSNSLIEQAVFVEKKIRINSVNRIDFTELQTALILTLNLTVCVCWGRQDFLLSAIF